MIFNSKTVYAGRSGISIGVLLFILFILLAMGTGCRGQSAKQELIIFHAGSLTVPFSAIIRRFEQQHPDITVKREIDGSRTCARKVSELHRECDILASADYTVIDELLIPEHADWNLKFASNEMAIVFTKQSRHAAEINSGNWFDILMDPNVSFGRSDPDSDPCGYRTILTIKLAEDFYKQRGLATKMLHKDRGNIRPKAIDLLALLNMRELDYIFLYRSVAQQHQLPYITLADQINLKTPKFRDYYSKASVRVSGKSPGTTITKRGMPMIYGLTILKNAPNRKMALAFLQLLLNQGMAIMEQQGQPSVIPAPTTTYAQLPEELKQYALPQSALTRDF